MGKWDFGNVRFQKSGKMEFENNLILGSGILGNWDFWKVGIWESGILGKRDFGKVGFWES